MQDALITELSKTDLRVIGQSSALRFRDTERSLPEIAAELDVAGLIEGRCCENGAGCGFRPASSTVRAIVTCGATATIATSPRCSC